MSTTSTTKSIKGTRTEQCLVKAYLGETDSYARYTYYASQAEKENYFPIQKIFADTATNELRHAKVFFKFLEGNQITVPQGVLAGIIGDTAKNLEDAIFLEKTVGVADYEEFAAIASSEGFPEIAEHFLAISKVEEHHLARFRRYLDQVKTGTVWKRDKPITWRCLVCGYEHVGTEPPEKCPACDHPYQHYMSTEPEDN